MTKVRITQGGQAYIENEREVVLAKGNVSLSLSNYHVHEALADWIAAQHKGKDVVIVSPEYLHGIVKQGIAIRCDNSYYLEPVEKRLGKESKDVEQQ